MKGGGSQNFGPELRQAGVAIPAAVFIHRELYIKDLHDPDNHNDVITHLEPDILECEVKRALRKQVCLVTAMVFPVVMYGCESWTLSAEESMLLNCGVGEDS